MKNNDFLECLFSLSVDLDKNHLYIYQGRGKSIPAALGASENRNDLEDFLTCKRLKSRMQKQGFEKSFIDSCSSTGFKAEKVIFYMKVLEKYFSRKKGITLTSVDELLEKRS